MTERSLLDGAILAVSLWFAAAAAVTIALVVVLLAIAVLRQRAEP